MGLEWFKHVENNKQIVHDRSLKLQTCIVHGKAGSPWESMKMTEDLLANDRSLQFKTSNHFNPNPCVSMQCFLCFMYIPVDQPDNCLLIPSGKLA